MIHPRVLSHLEKLCISPRTRGDQRLGWQGVHILGLHLEPFLNHSRKSAQIRSFPVGAVGLKSAVDALNAIVVSRYTSRDGV